jgi:thiamine-monophosphate kinase
MAEATLAEVGELALIERIRKLVRAQGGAKRHIAIGIGDDAAVLRMTPGEQLVVSSDARVEDVHFRWNTESARDIGRRAALAALSDLAAMGARPLGLTCALAAPAEFALERFDALLRGIAEEGAAQGAPLVGGNLTRARETSLALTVLGSVARGAALTRAGARAEDRLCVTGVIGAAALARLRAEKEGRRLSRLPPSRLAVGRALARMRGEGEAWLGGVIDVSVGLSADAAQLARAGRPRSSRRSLEAWIDPASVPRPPGFDALCRRLGADPDALLLGGGEDYELLFAIRADGPSAERLTQRLGVAVTEVGGFRERARAGRSERRAAMPLRGWRHF